MNKYHNGKIYTVRCKLDDSLIYVGSTTQSLNNRWAGHRSNFKQEKQISFFEYVKDINDWYIELYEDFKCENKEQLNKREGEVIRLIGNLNKRIAGRTEREYYNENIEKVKEYKKKYQQDNKEKLAEEKKEYYINNKEKLQEYKKQYQKDNKEEIALKRKQYRQANAEKVREQQKKYYEDRKKKLENV